MITARKNKPSFRAKRSALMNLCSFAALILGGTVVATVAADDSISERAKKLHFSSIVVDTHDDTTQLMIEKKFDLGERHTLGSIDIPRMREGGLSAIFFSIYLRTAVFRSGVKRCVFLPSWGRLTTTLPNSCLIRNSILASVIRLAALIFPACGKAA